MNFEELRNTIISLSDNDEWDSIEYIGKFREGGSNPTITISRNGEEINIKSFDIFKPHKLVKNEYKSVLNTKEKFNYFKYKINKNKEDETLIIWNELDSLIEKQNSALVFYDWINERMMTLIYEAEFPNGPTAQDADGDPLYETTWNSGIFIFQIKESELTSDITLIQKEESRKLKIKFPKPFIQALLEHQITTNFGELKDLWEPWDTLKIVSPHNSIPSLEKDKRVFYFMSEEKKR